MGCCDAKWAGHWCQLDYSLAWCSIPLIIELNVTSIHCLYHWRRRELWNSISSTKGYCAHFRDWLRRLSWIALDDDEKTRWKVIPLRSASAHKARGYDRPCLVYCMSLVNEELPYTLIVSSRTGRRNAKHVRSKGQHYEFSINYTAFSGSVCRCLRCWQKVVVGFWNVEMFTE